METLLASPKKKENLPDELLSFISESLEHSEITIPDFAKIF